MGHAICYPRINNQIFRSYANRSNLKSTISFQDVGDHVTSQTFFVKIAMTSWGR